MAACRRFHGLDFDGLGLILGLKTSLYFNNNSKNLSSNAYDHGKFVVCRQWMNFLSSNNFDKLA